MKEQLQAVASGKSLSVEQTIDAFELIMTGQASAAQVGALLGVLALRGPTVEEITGAATVMRRKVTPVQAPAGCTVVDTCGTGGTHSPIFNVSTTAALIAGAVGRPRNVVVAKHGNRSVTSKSGSSQALEALGVKVKVAPETETKCLDAAGMCFCFAIAHHPAMKHAGPIRAELGIRTIFNLLGPLTNPAGATRQLMGVYDAALTRPIAEVLQKLGAQHAMVVNGQFAGGVLGEITTTGLTQVAHLRAGSITQYTINPADYGIATPQPEALHVADAAGSAAVITRVLEGEKGPARDMVLLNTAAALIVADLAGDLKEGMALAGKAIDSGAAKATLEKVKAITQADPTPVG